MRSSFWEVREIGFRKESACMFFGYGMRQKRVQCSVMSAIRTVLLLIALPLLAVCILHTEQLDQLTLLIPPDEAIIAEFGKRTQEGDDVCFTALYQRYNAQINRYLVRIVGNPDEADDLAEETFIKAWRGLAGLHDGRHFRSCLYRIARNVALDHLRQKKRSQGFTGYPGADSASEIMTSFDGYVEARELIQLALLEVTPKPRACLLLHLNGFSWDEISRFMGLRKQSIGTYLSVARGQFRKANQQLEKRAAS